MKTHLVVSMVLLACLIAGFSGVVPVFAEQPQPIKLKFAHFMPATTRQAQLAEQWCREVEKRTNNRVKINFYPGSTLMPAPQTYDGVVKGISDIGWSIMSYTRGRFPLSEVIDLPLGYKSGYTATKLINEFYAKFKPKEFDEVKVLYLHAHGPGILVTRKRVASLEDLKGMKIRSTGLSAKVTQALGGVPVGMPITEAYDALSKNVAEGIMVPVEALQQWRLAEVTKFVTENYGSAYSTGFFCVMNKEKWQALPADIQKTIEKINVEWIEKTGRLWDQIDKEGRAYAVKQGQKFIPLTKEEDARWTERVRPILDDYVQTMKTKNLPGDEALRFCVDYLRKNQK